VVYRFAEPGFLKHEEGGDIVFDDEDDHEGAYTGLHAETIKSIYMDEVHMRMTE
jgi:hypothetical protein